MDQSLQNGYENNVYILQVVTTMTNSNMTDVGQGKQLYIYISTLCSSLQ